MASRMERPSNLSPLRSSVRFSIAFWIFAFCASVLVGDDRMATGVPWRVIKNFAPAQRLQQGGQVGLGLVGTDDGLHDFAPIRLV